MPVVEPGRVVEFASGLRWRVLLGRLVKTRAYDLGSVPPPTPVDAAGHLVQRLDRDAALEFVLDRLGDSFRIRPVRPAIRRILDWLEQFPGATWEERWLSSGADAAPRAWRASVVGPDEALQRKIGYAANALMAGRVLRPSYGWQLASKAGAHLPAKMLTVNDPDNAARLRHCRPTVTRCCGTSSMPRAACRG